MAASAQPMTAFIDPDDGRFLRLGPRDLPRAVAEYCRETRQTAPLDAGTLIRVLLESLALKYASVLKQLETVTGRSVRSVYVVGGGVQNSLLCQLTADATGLPVQAGST